MLDVNKHYMIPVDTDTEEGKLKEKVIRKLINEFNKYIDELYKLPPNAIVGNSYEKVCKEELVYILMDSDYSIDTYKLMLKEEYLLESLYEEWISFDGNFDEMLGYSVDKYVYFLKEKSIEKKPKEELIK